MATVTVRLNNPRVDFKKYTVDVEFQSDTANTQVFGMNTRFFYDSHFKANTVKFVDFQGGYGAAPPNPPYLNTSTTAGPPLFKLTGPVTYVNGYIQLLDKTKPVVLTTGGWTKLFSIELETNFAPSGEFCPSIILDLEQDTSRGGFLPGSEGIVITVVHKDPLKPNVESTYSTEKVVQFNWEYIPGSMFPPYGKPAKTNCITV